LYAALTILSGLAVGAGCAPTGELRVSVGENIHVPPRRVMVFLADGVRKDLLEQMIRDGRLPNLKHYLYDRGCWVDYAVSSIPSITYAAIASINTGRFPGHHEILGNKWFDRISGQFQNYTFIHRYQRVDEDLRAPTIYELLPDRFTVTIQTANRHGADRPIDNWMSSGIRWFFGDIEGVDRLVADRFEVIADCANQTGRWPDYITAYFPAVDEMGHRYGSDSRQYADALVNLDDQVGRICGFLDNNGLLKDYHLILVSDHGHAPIPRENYWLPGPFFRDHLGLNVVDHWFLDERNSNEWHRYLAKFQMVMINGGSRRIFLHLRAGKYWANPPSFDDARYFLRRYAPAVYERAGRKELPDLLLAQTAVGVVAMKVDANTVEVRTRTGMARITRKTDSRGVKSYRYDPIQNDPLGYRGHGSTRSMVGTGYYESRAWLEASCDSEYPDFVPQAVEMYDSHRAGQIAAFAAAGWDFSQKDIGGHGSVIHDDMIVPMMIAGPGISKTALKCARITDVMPTALDILGESDRLKTVGPIDGQSLLPILTTRPAR